ncbi:uncharacterized protein [Porites lutea]|uniref:uncharacterized protein n=1 Tax=Porites lutea TaxID=51062 RepID=UPI003CC5376F
MEQKTLLQFSLLKMVRKQKSFNVPSKPPSSINAKGHVSLTTIPVSWQPIDPQHINGVLLGYKIRYQAVAFGQEPAEDQPVLEKNVGTSALTAILENLDIFTLYRVDVLGYTVIGEGPAATDYAETCRCYKRLTTSWYEFPPYVQVQDDNIPSGLIPPILSKLAVTCCQTCQSHGKSYVDFNSNGLNTSARLRDLRTFKSSIGNPTDFFFPVYGFKYQTHFAKEFGYHGLVESPGMAYIINTNTQDDVPNAVLNNIISCWPAVTLFIVITYLSGLLVWAVESPCNPQDFPSSFTKGVPEGFYWAFVSTTTVGYGDRAPISFMGRILAIVVILTGLVLFSLVNGILATSITSIALETDHKIYGAKVAAIAETPEYRMGVRKNARMDGEYSTFEDIFTALHERKVTGALIDTYSAGSSKDIFAKHHFRVYKVLDYSSTYGVVMGKGARKLRKCFNDLTQHVYASEISKHIQMNTEQLKEPGDSLPVERSTGLFDSDSVVFQNTLILTSSLLISCLLLGIMYEIIRYTRSRAKIKPHESWHTSLNEMKGVVENFHQNMVLVKKIISSRHKKERKALLLFYQTEPKRKYESMAIITEDLFTNSLSEEDEAHC